MCLKKLVLPPLPSGSQVIIIGDLGSRDFTQLEQRVGDTSKKPTTETIPLEELITIIDSGAGAKCDTFIIESLHFLPVFNKQTTKALFDSKIREDWGERPVWCVCCEASIWDVHYAAWNLEEKDKTSEINFKSVPGANHFVRLFFFKKKKSIDSFNLITL